LEIVTPENVLAGGILSCRANSFIERLHYNVGGFRRNFARPGFYTAMIFGHDIAALKL
jgi:hypothetical protein